MASLPWCPENGECAHCGNFRKKLVAVNGLCICLDCFQAVLDRYNRSEYGRECDG